jgi:Ca2+-binding RTX toxin-like protein
MNAIDWTNIDTVVGSITWWNDSIGTFGNGTSNGVRTNSDSEFSYPQKQIIAEYLLSIHLAPGQEAASLNDRLSNGLNIYQTKDQYPILSNPNEPSTIGLNLTTLSTVYSINTSGVFALEDPRLLIAHDLSHTLLGTTDPVGADTGLTNAAMNMPGYDYYGDGISPGAVTFQNALASNLGLEDDQRASYAAALTAADGRFHLMQIGQTYTENDPVEIARYGNWGNEVDDIIDMHDRIENVLVLGLTGDDKIKTGSGNDYVYGGSGDDIINTGGGNNYINGGDLGGATLSDGYDTVSYSPTATAGPSAITVTLAPGINGEIGVANAFGGTDRLVSIEKIIGSPLDDTVVVDTISLASYGLSGVIVEGRGIVRSLTIDGGDGVNSIDFTQLQDVGLVVTASDGTTLRADAASQPASGDLLFTNFTHIIGPQATLLRSTFDLSGLSPSISVTIDGGDVGSIFKGNGNSHFTGGAGIDTFFFAVGGDTFDGGAGENSVDLSSAPSTTGFLSPSGYVVSLNNGTVDGGAAGVSLIANVQDIVGSAYTDDLAGSAGDNVVNAGAGNDIVHGTAGIDRIDGGAGTDTLVLSGVKSDYVIGDTAGNGYQKTIELRSGGTADLVNGIEKFQFDDGILEFAALEATSRFAGRLTETPNASGLADARTTTGTFTFQDADMAGVHTVSAGAPVVSVSGGGSIPTDTLAALAAALAITPHDSTGTGLGYVDWSFSIADAGLDFLAKDQVLTAAYTVTIDDGQGNIDNEVVTQTITGTDDAVIVVAADKSQSVTIAEAANATGVTAPDHQSGTIRFSDLDLSDRPTAALASQTVVYTDAAGGIHTLSSAQLAAVQNAFTLSADPGNAGAGSAGWQYSIPDNALDFLGVGETIVVTNIVAVDDHNGSTDTAAVTVTLNGANDAPTMPTLASGSTTQNGAPLVVDLLAGGSDPDTNDVLSVPSGSLTVVSSDGHAVAGTLNGRFLTIAPAQFQYLGAGQSVTLTYHYSVGDGHAFVQNTGTAVVTGLNDAPTGIVWNSGGAVLENSANGTVVGVLRAVDPDQADTASWALLDNAGGRFALSAAGVVTVANGTLLDYEAATGHDLVVRETDSGGLTTQQIVHVGLVNQAGVTLNGTSGNDTLTGTGEEDVIYGLAGADTINAGGGNDLVMPGTGANHSDGGAGVDTLSYAGASAGVTDDLQSGTVSAGSSGETAVNFENFVGTDFSDTVFGTSGVNRIETGAGVDAIFGRGGADWIDGGSGFDYVYFDFTTASQPIVANLLTGQGGGAIAGSTLLNIEGVTGGAGNDTLTAGNGGGYLAGGAGNDVLTGGLGNDTEIGGAGHDTFYGSPGADAITDTDNAVFDYSGSPGGVSLISNGTTYAGSGGWAQGDTIIVAGVGSSGAYEWHLSDFADVLRLRSADAATVYTGAGDDAVYGQTGHLTVVAGSGYDFIHPGGDGDDTIYFGAGGGVLDYAAVPNRVVFNWAEPGGTSTVQVFNGYSNTQWGAITNVSGSFGTFNGSSITDVINGNSQDNVITGGGGNDVITGGGGNDTITGMGTIHGGDGNDAITITPDFNANGFGDIYGDAGNDWITLGVTNRGTTSIGTIHGGTGNNTIDVATYGTMYTTVFAGPGNDTIYGNNNVNVSYAESPTGISFVGNTAVAGSYAVGDTLLGGVRHLTGSGFGDSFVDTGFDLYLGAGNNVVVNNSGVVYGNIGNDVIVGSGGNDTIHTGGGNDVVTGGHGNDVIYLEGGAGEADYFYGDGADVVFNFTQGADSLGIGRLAGAVDPVVSIGQINGSTDVHVRWYASEPVDGEPEPLHVDADIILQNVALTSFNQGTDFHLI